MSESSFGFVEPVGTPTQYAGCVRALSKALGELADTREALERAEAMVGALEWIAISNTTCPHCHQVCEPCECEPPGCGEAFCRGSCVAQEALTAWRAGTQAKSGETGIVPTFRSDPG